MATGFYGNSHFGIQIQMICISNYYIICIVCLHKLSIVNFFTIFLRFHHKGIFKWGVYEMFYFVHKWKSLLVSHFL